MDKKYEWKRKPAAKINKKGRAKDEVLVGVKKVVCEEWEYGIV